MHKASTDEQSGNDHHISTRHNFPSSPMVMSRWAKFIREDLKQILLLTRMLKINSTRLFTNLPCFCRLALTIGVTIQGVDVNVFNGHNVRLHEYLESWSIHKILISFSLKDRLSDQRVGGWMGADKNSSRRRLKLQQDELARSDPQNHMLCTSTFRLPKQRSYWSATGPRNKHYQQRWLLHQPDSWNNSGAGW
jgi:hypothetical protein